MTSEQVWAAMTGAAALVGLVLAAVAWRRAARAEARALVLGERLNLLEAPAAAASVNVQTPGEATYVITRLDQDTAGLEPMTAQRLEGRLFADIVARESVVKAASWTHGLRRALAPATRNRIRFQMRQETKRAGRERKAEMKLALREHRARGRAEAADVSGLGEDVA